MVIAGSSTTRAGRLCELLCLVESRNAGGIKKMPRRLIFIVICVSRGGG